MKFLNLLLQEMRNRWHVESMLREHRDRLDSYKG
jgi:hypothetical protein